MAAHTCPPVTIQSIAPVLVVEAPTLSTPHLPQSSRPKKRRKKMKYNDLMASITQSASSNNENEDEKRERHAANLRKNLGGGAFSKLDRI